MPLGRALWPAYPTVGLVLLIGILIEFCMFFIFYKRKKDKEVIEKDESKERKTKAE